MSTSRHRALAGFLCSLALLPQLPAQTKQGNQFLNEGKLHEARKEWDAALASYNQALAEDPTSTVYQLTAAKARVMASQAHLDKGLKSRSTGNLPAALTEFQQAASIDPGSAIARQELVEIHQLIERGTVPSAQQTEAGKIARMRAVPELHPTIPGRINLKLTAKTKVAFETICKSAGLSILWDPDFAPPAKDLLTLNLSNATPDQALDEVALKSNTTWKRLSPTTIYVANQ